MNKKAKKIASVTILIFSILVLVIQFKRYLYSDFRAIIFTSSNSKITYHPQLNSQDHLSGFRSVFSEFPSVDETKKPPVVAPTQWQKQNQKIYREMVESKRYDFIITPVQDVTQQNDNTGKMLAASYISRLLAKAPSTSVMNPELVARTLGERQIAFEDEKLFKIASKTGSKIIHLILGSYQTSNINLAVVITDAKGNIESFQIYPLKKIKPKQTLEKQVKNISHTIVENIIKNKHNQLMQNNTEVSDISSWTLHGTVPQILEKLRTPTDHAAYLQLLAQLSPPFLRDDQAHLFERSLVALEGGNPQSSINKLLKARALHYLGRRPQALDSINDLQSNISVAVTSFLNGNHNGLKDALTNISNPLLYTLFYLDLALLSDAYGKEMPQYDTEMADENWKILVKSATDNYGSWYKTDPINSLKAMAKIFPDFNKHISTNSLKSLHINKYWSKPEHMKYLSKMIGIIEGKIKNTANPHSFELSPFDFWCFYKNTSLNHIYGKLKQMVFAQSDYKSAKKYGEVLAPIFGGNPSYDMLMVSSIIGLAERSALSSSGSLIDKALKLDCQVRNSLYAYEYERVAGVYMSLKTERLAEGRGFHCVPHIAKQSGSYFPSDIIYKHNNTDNAGKIIPYLTTSFIILENAFEKGAINLGEFNKEYSTRFDGSPRKLQFQVKSSNDDSKKIILLKNSISKGNQEWSTYDMLGLKLLEMNRIFEARDTYLSFPEFNSRSAGKRIATSNMASIAGIRFFDFGHYEIARHFFNLSDSFNTGSKLEYFAKYKLSILDKDFQNAVDISHKSWKRYNNINSLRDYLTNLCLVEPDSNYQDIFGEMFRKYNEPHKFSYFWLPLFIHHRHKSVDTLISVEKLSETLSSTNMAALKAQTYQYIFLQGVIDRKLLRNYSDKISKFNSVNYKFIKKPYSFYGNLFYPEDICPSWENDCKSTYKFENKNDEFDLFSILYLAIFQLQHNENEMAVDTFIILDTLSSMINSGGSLNFALPYAAMAFVESPRVTKEIALKFVSAVNSKEKDYNIFSSKLTRAILYSYLGDINKSLELLESAKFQDIDSEWKVLDFNGDTSNPIFSWYLIVFEAEWLYKYSGNKAYLKIGLETAKRIQLSHPQLAWAFAFEALYSNDEKARIEAAGYANFLDPKSYWLSQVHKSILNKGKVWWNIKNPFIQQNDPKETAMFKM